MYKAQKPNENFITSHNIIIRNIIISYRCSIVDIGTQRKRNKSCALIFAFFFFSSFCTMQHLAYMYRTRTAYFQRKGEKQ